MMDRETIKITTTAPRLMTEAEAIDALALGDRPNPVGALRWLVRTKRLPSVTIARGIVRFHPDDVARFIEARRA